ncbi:MAG: tetratricopeptide repeat protein [Planctomycetota bacterium]
MISDKVSPDKVSIDINNEFRAAIQYHQSGQLQKAEDLYTKILEINPYHSDSLHFLGVIAHQVGKNDIAVNLIQKAIQINSQDQRYYSNMGVALKALGKSEEAVACYRKALEIKPDYASAYYNMANTLRALGKPEEAIACYRKALEIKPDYADAFNNMANTLKDLGKSGEAIACYHKALEIKPGDADACYNMGNALKDMGKPDEAVAYYRKALEIKPDYADAYFNMGITMRDMGKYLEAIACYQKALKIKPDFADVYNNMGYVLKDLGKSDEAITCYRKALEIKPDWAAIHSNLIFALQYDSSMTGEMLLEECRRWDDVQAAGFKPLPHENVPDPERRIRVGYVSGDFREHAVAYLLEPLLSAHNKTVVEVFCYAEVRKPDAITRRFQEYADHWWVTEGVGDDELVAMIRSDRIDILVDCGGHATKNRLPAVARKPAPVQVATLLGHGGATGLRSLDYVLGDPYVTPPGFEKHFTETIVRLPHYAPFRPKPGWPEVFPLPAAKARHVVFGYLGTPARIDRETIALWCQMIEAVAGSRLLLKHHTIDNAETHRFCREAFSAIADRVDFEGVPGGWERNMDVYGRIDIVLDGFPVTGGTTTLIPLWMGVPVITLAGVHTGQRFGASILNNVGLSDLVAETPEEFVKKAAKLANDIDRLTLLRNTLRDRMASSPLCDARRITADIESAYQDMWRAWCSKQLHKD